MPQKEIKKTAAKRTKKEISTSKPKRGVFWVILVLVALVVSLAIVYSAEAYYHQTTLPPRTKILNMNVADGNLEQIKQKTETANSNIKNYQIEIAVQDKTEKIAVGDLGISVDSQKTAQSAFKTTHWGKWLKPHKLFQALILGLKIKPAYNIDKQKLQVTIKEKFKDLEKEPKNAGLEIKDEELKTFAGEAGTLVDYQKIIDEIWASLKNDRLPLKITGEVKPTPPSINIEQAETAKKTIEEFANHTFTLKVEDKGDFSAGGINLVRWLDLPESVNQKKAVLSHDGVKEFLASVGKKINKYAVDRKVTSDGEVIEEGEDGLILDDVEAEQNIFSAIAGGLWQAAAKMKEDKSEEKIVPRSSASGGGTPGLYPGKYIELNLSTQTLYCFEGENEICAYRVSTGKWSMPTPTGTFAINSKTEMAYSATYGLYMPWWMSFIGNDYGIHELPEWPGGAKEGESHLGTPVSHGCVRLGVGAAESVYGWAEIGTPVVVHY